MEDPVWVCAFAIYQNNDISDGPTINQQIGPKPKFGPLAIILVVADSMLAVITGDEICEIYT